MNNETKKCMGKKILAVMLSLVLMAGSVAGGTYAWLVAKSEQVVNTFTYGDINITLTETDVDGDDNTETNTYKMVPGVNITKDPVVTVQKDNEKCWLFVKLRRSTSPDFNNFMEYTVADGWTPLSENENNSGEYIYFCIVDADTDGNAETFPVIKDNTVSVKQSVTKDMLNALGTTYPTLSVTAYAVQYAGFEPAGDTADEISAAASAAWAQVATGGAVTP